MGALSPIEGHTGDRHLLKKLNMRVGVPLEYLLPINRPYGRNVTVIWRECGHSEANKIAGFALQIL